MNKPKGLCRACKFYICGTLIELEDKDFDVTVWKCPIFKRRMK